MKKALALLLALVMCLSLVACGGGKQKVAGTWVSIWNDEDKLILNTDGSGSILGYECKWKLDGDTITISYKSVLGKLGGLMSGGTPEYKIVNENGVEVLKKGNNTEYLDIADDLVREGSYNSDALKIKNDLQESAVEIKWSDFVYELYEGNAARAKANYEGKPITTTVYVYEIYDDHVVGSDYITYAAPQHSATVFLSTADILQINKGDTITICGYFDEQTFNTDHSVYSPIEPAFLVSID